MAKPKIRFKGYTNDWEQRKLGEVCSRVQGNDGRMDLPTLTISAANGWMNQEDRFSGNIAGKEQKNYTLLHKGELSYNHGNSKLAKYGTVFSLQSYKEALVPRVYHSFKVEEGSPDFLEYYFATKLPDRELGKLISSGARMDGLLNIGYNEFMEIQMLFPLVEEQKQISNYFRNLDHLITLHQRKCDQAKKLKKYMLQKMFPKNNGSVPEIRFEGFSNDWEQRRWIDTVDISTEMVDPTSGEYDDMPHIAPGNIEAFTGRILNNVKTVKEEQLISGKFRFRPGNVVYGKINPQLGKYFYATVDGLTSADAYVFNGKNGLRQKFLFSQLQTNDFFKYSVSVSKRSGMPKINRDELNAYTFFVPHKDEQDKIGDFLLGIDHLITLHQKKCDQLKNLKKFMLQNMFV